VLSFATPPLAEDLEVAAPLELRLWVSEGLLRLRYRNSWEEPNPMRPGEVYPVTIAMFPTANLLRHGHRLRLDIAGSNFPQFEVNPNSGETEGSSKRPRKAITHMFVDRERASVLTMPVIPPGA
jgi:putative CocE/NonD family hydrolase